MYKEDNGQNKKEKMRKPEWLKVKLPAGENYSEVKELLRKNNLHTVCQEAHCPNIGECFNNRTATFMILGDECTRNCRFCNVKAGKEFELDKEEPARVAAAINKLKLRHAVITSVTRDDLPDGGADIFRETVKLTKEYLPDCTVEILIPDFLGNEKAFKIILKNPPDILNHNLETVKRLYKRVRPQAVYERSLELLQWFSERGLTTKSGLMVGIGEETDEVLKAMTDLREYRCDFLTIGQYLQPGPKNVPVDRFVTPEEFGMYREEGLKMGFRDVVSEPLVRSSYHADRQARLLKKK